MTTKYELTNDDLSYAKHIAYTSKRFLPKHVDTDELIALAYLGAVKASNNYDPALGDFKPYLHVKAKGEILTFIRGVKRRKKIVLENVISNEMLDEASHKKDSFDQELFDHLTHDLNSLEKTIVDLYFFHGLTQEEIGSTMGRCKSGICQILKSTYPIMRDRLSKV